MTFEEFFRKKRIDTAALQAAEPMLFLEFETHFEQMGEKSFDHTKKYWFNKLRLLYHLAPEQKPDKVHIENQLAEQTIVETLTEPVIQPKVGFKPRFNAAAVKPKTDKEDAKNISIKESTTIIPEANEASVNKEQSEFETEKKAAQSMANDTPRSTDTHGADPSAKKPGFKPRFNMKAMAQKPTEEVKETIVPENVASDVSPAASDEKPGAKSAYKPKFNMKNVKPEPPQEEE